MTMRCSGRTVFSNTLSLVRNGTSARPGIGGTVGAEPVAMTMRRAEIACSPALTSFGPVKRAAAAMTRTPSPVKRSTKSCGAIAAITPCTWRITAAKSTAGGAAPSPNSALPRAALTRLAAASSAFDGTQP